MVGASGVETLRVLVMQFPQIPAAEIESVLAKAELTVERLTGETDPAAAADLACLRLEIRRRFRRSTALA